MRSGAQIYREVAERCGAYDRCGHRDCFCNSITSDDEVSCLTCRHFAEDEHCRLDLYDPIAKNL